MNVHSMTGSNVQQGTTNSSIAATQTITTEQLAEDVRNLVEQLDRALPTLPVPVQEQTREVLTELRAAATVQAPDASRLRRGLESLTHINGARDGALDCNWCAHVYCPATRPLTQLMRSRFSRRLRYAAFALPSCFTFDLMNPCKAAT
jgi:hypothetical protein